MIAGGGKTGNDDGTKCTEPKGRSLKKIRQDDKEKTTNSGDESRTKRTGQTLRTTFMVGGVRPLKGKTWAAVFRTNRVGRRSPGDEVERRETRTRVATVPRKRRTGTANRVRGEIERGSAQGR